MPDSPSPLPRLVGQAESALGALLAPLLAEAGITFPQWVVLTLAAAGGAGPDGVPGIDRDQLVAQATAARRLEPAELAAVLGELEAAGAVTTQGGRVRLTASGQAAFAQVRSRVAETTAYLFDQPAEDLTVAGRVLATITARAAEVLATR
jgi:DNA-binding MarR family transcriptional regulator